MKFCPPVLPNKTRLFAVVFILEIVMINIKVRMTIITETVLRADNVGCYHYGLLCQAIPGIT